MSVSNNLSLRIAAMLLIGFILIQTVATVLLILPNRVYEEPASNLPPPEQVKAMAATLEALPPDLQAGAIATFDDSTFQAKVVTTLPSVRSEREGRLSSQREAYLAAFADRPVLLWREGAIIHHPLENQPGPQNFIDPTKLAVGLRDGRWLLIDSRPSAAVQAYMRKRAYLGIALGTVMLFALGLAVRQTTRPISQLSRRIRDFSDKLDAPDLPLQGAQELRDVSAAFNDMKARIRGLVNERTRLLAAVAHDMRTYLTRLRLRAEFIDDPEHRQRAIRDLAEMHDLLEDTLLFARQDALPEPELRRIDLGAELMAMEEICRETGDAIVIDPLPSPLPVKAEPLALRRIFANLIDNGLRYGSHVHFRADRHGNTVTLTVEDDGPGVPEPALARLGEPFERLDPSRDRATGGAGLGLAIVRALAERNGIAVHFENAPASGLRVILTFTGQDGGEDL